MTLPIHPPTLAARTADPARLALARRQGIRYLFVPERLAPLGQLHSCFPRNVLFTAHRASGVIQACYEPRPSTLRRRGPLVSMQYTHPRSERFTLLVTHDTRTASWSGARSVDGAAVDSATGRDWSAFFLNLTAAGLLPGEPGTPAGAEVHS